MKMYKIEVAVFVADDEMDETAVAALATKLLDASVKFDDVSSCTATEVKD